MKRIISRIRLVYLIVASLLVLISCSTNKKATIKNGDASVTANAPDYEQIKKDINKKDSEFYYPELLRRFQEADTTLGLEQLRHFYYGTATRPEYNPYQFDLSKALNEALEKKDLQQAKSIIDRQLAKDPTNLKFYMQKMMVNIDLYGRESEEANSAFFQVYMLLSAILSSGDGKTKESAIYVINIADEYAIMYRLGVTPTSQSLMEHKGQSYDVMELAENEYGLKSMYFNITVRKEAMKKLFGF